LDNPLKSVFFWEKKIEADEEVLHLRRMHRIQKLMGNLPDRNIREVENQFSRLSQEFHYPVWEISRILEWILDVYHVNPTDYLEELDKVLKTARNLGRNSLKTLGRLDLKGVIEPFYH